MAFPWNKNYAVFKNLFVELLPSPPPPQRHLSSLLKYLENWSAEKNNISCLDNAFDLETSIQPQMNN